MRNLIITRSQLKEMIKRNLTEDIDIAVKAKNNSTSDYLSALKSPETSKDIMKAKGITPDVNAVVSGPKTSNESPKIDVEVPMGSSAEEVINKQPEIGNAITNKGAEAFVHGDGFPMESKVYSKKKIEEARLYEMRKKGIVMTKKQLTEEALSSQNTVNIENLLGQSNVFNAMEAFRLTYGDEELEKIADNWGVMDNMIKIYENSSPEKQQEFVARLKGEYQDDIIDLELDFGDEQ